MANSQRVGHIDLFDDPAWNSSEGRQEAAFYDRMSAIGLPGWMESTVSVAAVGAFVLWVASALTLVWVVNDMFNQFTTSLFGALGRLLNSI